MKINFKKITAVATSLLMIGASVGFAAGASVNEWVPTHESTEIAVVSGTGAGVDDTVATNSISDYLTAQVKTSGGTPTGGESYKFEKTAVKFHLGDALTKIKSTLDDDELPTLLADGKYIDDDNDEFDYSQKIEVNGSLLTMWEDNDYMEDEPTVGFRIVSGQNVLNYTITFDDEPLLGDLVSTDLALMGKEYYVLSNTTSGSNFVLTLLDSASDTILAEGETTTLDVEGDKYDVTINFISSSEVKLDINSETTNSLNEGETQKLSDGSYVGVKDIMYNAKDVGISKVEFSIGSGKLKLTSGSEVQVNDETVSGVTAVITNSSGTVATSTLASIEIEWKTDEDTFITDDTEITMPEFEIVKLSYGGLNYPTEEIIRVKQGGDFYATLDDFPLKNGPADIDFLYGNSTNGRGFVGIGKDSSNKLITSNSTRITFDRDTDEYFVVSYAATTEGESYLTRITNPYLDGTHNKTDFEIYSNGDWTTTGGKTGVKSGDTFSIGNCELGVQRIHRSGKWVNITANASATNFYHLYTKEGLRTYLPFEAGNKTVPDSGAINFSAGGNTVGHNATSFYLNFTEEDKDGNIGSGQPFAVVVGWDSSTTEEVEVTDLINENVSAIEIQDTDVFRSFMYGDLATEFLWNKPTSGQDSIKIIYHGDEVTADVYITAPEVVLSGEVGSMVFTDAEKTSWQNRDVILVGGSCINSATAEALGVAYPTCEDAFTTATGIGSGQYLIQSVGDAFASEKIALVVAGYSKADTAAAAQRITNLPSTIDTTAGNKYLGIVGVTGDSTISKVA